MSSSLESKRVRLRPYCENDMEILYKWRNRQDFISLFSRHRYEVTYEQFTLEHRRDSKRERHLQYIVERVRDDAPLGITYDYTYNSTDGFAFFGGYIATEYQKLGYGAIGAALFLRYLFSTFPIRKIYTEVAAYNTPSIRLMNGLGFEEEGKFVNHRYMFGEYHDLYRYALYRRNLEGIENLLYQPARGVTNNA